MQYISEIEDLILIEANDFNVPVQNVFNDVWMTNKSLNREEAYKLTSSVIGSMVAEGLVELVMTHHIAEREDVFSPFAERYLKHEEIELILKHPELWDEKDVFSFTDTYQLKITEKGRDVFEQVTNGTIAVVA